MRALVAAPLTALALVACSGSDLSPREQVAEAATRTAAAESMRTSFTAVLDDETLEGGSLELSGEGEFTGENGRMTMELPPLPDLPGGGEIEAVMTGTVIYFRMPFFEGVLPKPWIEFDLQAAGEDLGLDFRALMDASRRQNPAESLDQLRAVGDVEELGEATVRGVGTRHYRGTVDLERYARLLEEEGDEAAAETVRRTVELTGQDTVPMELWIDGDDRVRRLEWTQVVPAGLPHGSAEGSMTMTMDLYDFGADVRVGPPPADQVMSFEELLELES